jgi:hypothetical protein
LRYSDTENNFRYSKGDRFITNDGIGYVKFEVGEKVIVDEIIYGEEKVGVVIDINARYVVPEIEQSWKVEYLVIFNLKTGDNIYIQPTKKWLTDVDLRKWSLDEEREWKLNNILS